jgi:hypothetical protein
VNINELILRLEAIREQHGNIEVVSEGDGGYCDVGAIDIEKVWRTPIAGKADDTGERFVVLWEGTSIRR